MGKKRRDLGFAIFLILGVGLFIYFLFAFGKEAVNLIYQNISFKYFGIYVALHLFTFCPLVWRLQVILKAHKKRIPFFPLLKQTIAGYAVSYITPSVRMGGEPLRVYMMKKESGIDVKTGTSCIVLDKFVEFVGSAIYGVVGLGLIMFIPGVPIQLKLILGVAVFIASASLLFFYYRTILSKGSFSSIVRIFKFDKTKKGKKFLDSVLVVEERMAEFFKKDHKAFFISFLFYCMSGVLFVLEFKFLLLSIGVETGIIELIILITLLGLANIAPSPGGIGFLEATQSGLFYAIRNDGSIGFALSLIVRIMGLFMVAVGFLLISQFSGKEIWKKMKSESKELDEIE